MRQQPIQINLNNGINVSRGQLYYVKVNHGTKSIQKRRRNQRKKRRSEEEIKKKGSEKQSNREVKLKK